MASLNTRKALVLLVLSCHIWTALPEIHRAKPRTKLGSRFSSRQVHVDGVHVDGEGLYENAVWSDRAEEEIEDRHSNLTWIYSLCAACVVGLSGIFPLIVIPLEAGRALRQPVNSARLKLLLSFAVGGLLGDVFLHLLPEAWSRIKPGNHGCGASGHGAIGLWVMTGLLAFMIIEKAFPDKDDDDDESDYAAAKKDSKHITANGYTEDTVGKSHKRTQNKTKNGKINGSVHQEASSNTNTADSAHHIKTCGWLNLAANIIDNFTHGLAVAGSFCISHKTGALTTAAILLHEIPHEIGDFAILLRAGFDRWEAAKAQLLTASGGLFGAFTALAAESAQAAGDRTAWVLPFTSGGFLYIALVSVVPELLKDNQWQRSLQQIILLMCGVGVMAAVTLLCDA